MKKLSDYKDKEALAVLARIIVPTVEIFGDTEVSRLYVSKDPRAISVMIDKHMDSVMELLAGLEGVPVEEYHCTLTTLPIYLLQIVNDKDLRDFFTSQAQTDSPEDSGSVTENTEVTEDTSSTI